MPKFTEEELHTMMNKTDNIRSVSLITPSDHGNSTLTDLLSYKAGIVLAKPAREAARFLDRRQDSQERCIATIKSTAAPLYFELDREDGAGPLPHLINLVDTPGHLDFSSDVTAALRVTDGALVVIDCIQGCAVQVETVLRQALVERVKPCLFVDRVGRCILELQMEPEDAFHCLRKAIDNVNVTISTCQDALMGDVLVCPERGTVAFGSVRDGWGFNIERFAKIYAMKIGVDKDKMAKRLWGDSFFDAKKKTWTNEMQPEGVSEPLPRAFCQFILGPITQLMRAIMNDNKARYEKMMTALGVTLKGDDTFLTGKQLMRRTMQTWINAADTLLAMAVMRLPSPRTAQKYRVENLYNGPMHDAAANAIRSCDPTGALVMYVSKLVPTSEGGRLYAFGRVFSGSIALGQRVRIQGPHYKVGQEEDLNTKNIERTALMMGCRTEQIDEVPCGNIVALAGVDQHILNSGTITTLEDAHNIADIEQSIS